MHPPQSLPCHPYTLHFPSSYQLTLTIPEQTTIHELTQIMQSYTILHREHGLKVEGRVLGAGGLASLQGDLLGDLYLMGVGDGEIGGLRGKGFRVVYRVEGKDERNVDEKRGFCPVQKYHFVGKLPESEVFIVRDRQTCQLHTINLIPKSSLTFPTTQTLLSYLTHFKSPSSSSLSSSPFAPLHSSFQTRTHISLVQPCQPFQLDRLKIDSKYLMDTVLGQLARILHVLGRDWEEIGQLKMGLGEFSMDFGFRVYYCGSFWEKKLGDGEISGNYAEKFTGLLEDMLKNCSMRIIELYIPLLHWLKNGRIANYMDFLKYSQSGHQPTPQFEPYFELQQKKKLILHSLMKTYPSPKLLTLSEPETLQFSHSYTPKTQIFTHFHPQPQTNNLSCLKQQKSHRELQDLLENISTVKKKKHEPAISVKAKPIYEVRSLLKCKKFTSKGKGKENGKQNRSQFIGNNRNRTSKSKRHERKISQFLIED